MKKNISTKDRTLRSILLIALVITIVKIDPEGFIYLGLASVIFHLILTVWFAHSPFYRWLGQPEIKADQAKEN